VAQGIGSALLEESAYDEDGYFLSGTLVDYLLPTATDVPAIELHHLESEPLAEVNFRGVGEGGAICSPAAVSNAVEDALLPFGARITQLYLPPPVVLGLCPP
jgi:aerobic carbon-monoxide dehydrogenase large subunit